jgi:hypothetical protein
MKILVTESQYRKILMEETQEKKILKFPSLEFFDEDREVAWNIIQKILERKGNPPYSIEGDLDLHETPIESLGNLQSVGGYLDLRNTPIKSLGNLQSVGGYLNLWGTPLSKKYTEEQIREMVDVGSRIYM